MSPKDRPNNNPDSPSHTRLRSNDMGDVTPSRNVSRDHQRNISQGSVSNVTGRSPRSHAVNTEVLPIRGGNTGPLRARGNSSSQTPLRSTSGQQSSQLASKPGQLAYSLDPSKRYIPIQTLRSEPTGLKRSLRSGETFTVITNHLTIKKYPSVIHEYEVKFKESRYTAREDGKDVIRTHRVTRHDEKQNVIKALEGHRLLEEIPWAANTKSIFTVEKLHKGSNTRLGFQNIEYTAANGRREIMEGITLQYIGSANLTRNGRYEAPGVTSPERNRMISGLNAMIAKVISSDVNIFQPRANKFYLKNGWTRLDELPPRNEIVPAVHPNQPPGQTNSRTSLGEAKTCNICLLQYQEVHSCKRRRGDLLAYRGYFTSVQPSESGLLLNVNTTASAFFLPTRLSDMMLNLRRLYPQQPAKDVIEKLLKGLRVRRIYDLKVRTDGPNLNTENYRSRTIANLGGPPDSIAVDLKHGPEQEGKKEKKKVADYFRVDLGLPISHPDLPCVNIGRRLYPGDLDSEGTWIPPEYLEVQPFQLFARLLPASYTTNMLAVACRYPHQNRWLIVNEGIQKLQLDKLWHDFNIDIDPHLRVVPALKLQVSNILYLSEVKKPQLTSWNLQNTKFIRSVGDKTANIDNLHIIRLQFQSNLKSDALSREHMLELAHKLAEVMRSHGVDCPFPKSLLRVSLDNTVRPWHSEPDYFPTLEPIFQKLEMTSKTFAVVVLPSKDPAVYAAIKKINDCMTGGNTICLVDQTVFDFRTPKKPALKNRVEQILSNLALKFAAKLGGDVHRVDGLRKLGKYPTVVMGADVTHPQSGSTIDCPSIASVVGSLDAHFMRLPGSVRLQGRGKETIEEIGDMILERLEAWSRHNPGIRPENLLFYRDGVGESQYQAIQNIEIASIRQACSKFLEIKFGQASPEIKITFIVVGKRHHTRFYPSASEHEYLEGGTRNVNVTPGFVVEKEITMENGCDFYLQSHSALKGTARPAHYIVLASDMGLSMKEIQDLTHAFCYAYSRATRGVSYCAPAYCADRLCERMRCYLREWLINDTKLSGDGKWRRPREVRFEGQIEAWQNQVARRLSMDKFWNSRPNRKNPWHPNMDNINFYL